VLDIVKLVEGEYIHIDARPGEARETLADNTKAKAMLNWSPTQIFEDWVKNNRPQ
jgi:UDP-glucose 4-epimerase